MTVAHTTCPYCGMKLYHGEVVIHFAAKCKKTPKGAVAYVYSGKDR